MNAEDYTEGMAVVYVPTHARHEPDHRDRERGVVHRVESPWVFVKFPNSPNAKACHPSNLLPDK